MSSRNRSRFKANQKITPRQRGSLSRSVRTAKAVAGYSEFQALRSYLAKRCPCLKEYLQSLGTHLLPLVGVTDEKGSACRVKVWLPNEGVTERVSRVPRLEDFLAMVDKDTPFSTSTPYENVKRLLAANNQVGTRAHGEYVVPWAGWVFVLNFPDNDTGPTGWKVVQEFSDPPENASSAFAIPHAWLTVTSRSSKRHYILDPSLSPAIASGISEWVVGDEKELDVSSLTPETIIKGETPHTLVYVGTPQPPDIAEMTHRWWCTAVADSRTGVTPLVDTHLPSTLRFIKDLANNPQEPDDGEAEAEAVQEESTSRVFD